MKKKIGISVLLVVIIGLFIGAYLWFQPKRDITEESADYQLTVSQLVEESLNDFKATNNKYLSSDGESKVLVISGVVESISENQKGQKNILLKSGHQKAGVNCTFYLKTNSQVDKVKPGDQIKIKGEFKLAANFDADFEEYMDATLEKCSIVQ